MKFTDAYAPAPLCSASRAAILSGWAPARQHIHGVTPSVKGESPWGFHNYTSWQDEALHQFPPVYANFLLTMREWYGKCISVRK